MEKQETLHEKLNTRNPALEYEKRKKEEMDFVDREMKYLEKMHRYFKLKSEIAKYQLEEFMAMTQINQLTNQKQNVISQDMQSGGTETTA